MNGDGDKLSPELERPTEADEAPMIVTPAGTVVNYTKDELGIQFAVPRTMTLRDGFDLARAIIRIQQGWVYSETELDRLALHYGTVFGGDFLTLRGNN